jgi:hypothetical protein
LRDICIGGILQFGRIAEDEKGREGIASKIGVSAEFVVALLSSLKKDPAYIRLVEVEVALAQPLK